MALNENHRLDAIASKAKVTVQAEAYAVHGKYSTHRNKPWMQEAYGLKPEFGVRAQSAVQVADKSRFRTVPRREGKHVLTMSGKGQGPRFQGMDSNGKPVWA